MLEEASKQHSMPLWGVGSLVGAEWDAEGMSLVAPPLLPSRPSPLPRSTSCPHRRPTRKERTEENEKHSKHWWDSMQQAKKAILVNIQDHREKMEQG